MDELGTTRSPAELPASESLTVSGAELNEKAEQLISRFVEAMDDDFNTAQALGTLFETVRATNRFLAETTEFNPVALSLVARIRHLLTETGSVLGLFNSSPVEWLENKKSSKATRIDVSPEEIERLIAERAEARKTRDFKRGDEIRDILLEKGVQLLDSAQGTTWKVK